MVWGILRLLAARLPVPHNVIEQENSWALGQVMPLVLIGLPLMAVTESVFHRMLVSLLTSHFRANLREQVGRLSTLWN
jgi:hypothetical protein